MPFKPQLLSHLLDTANDESELQSQLDRADDQRADDIEREISINKNRKTK